MAPRPGTYQAAFGSGELDARAHGRTDIKQYYQGASRMNRAVPVAQSGFTNEGVLGSQALGRIRAGLAPLSPTITSFSNPGVSLPTLLDPSTVKATLALGVNAQIIIADLGSAVALAAFDLLEFSAAAETVNRPLRCETSLDGVNWIAFGKSFTVTKEARSRRFSLPPQQVRQARFVRLVIVAASVAPGVMSLRAVRAFQQAAPAAFRVRRFTFSRTENYYLVFSATNVDVWRDKVWQTAIPVDLTAAQIPAVDPVQQLDTMFLLHEDVEPLRLMRQGADDEWTCWKAPFRRVPDVDYGGVYTNGIPAVFTIELVNASYPCTFALTVSGEDTETIFASADTTETANLIRAKIESLPSVEPGIGVATVGASAWTVSFTGAGNEGDGWSMTGRIVNSVAVAIVVSHTQKGKAGGEPLMSAARGWPSCGSIYQQRLVLSGFRTKPNGVLASVLGDYFDFATDIVADTGAYLFAVDTVGSERIERMVFGTFLQFLSSEREYYLTDPTLKRSQAPNIRQSTSNGIRRGVPAATTDTSTLIIHKNGVNVVELVYSDGDQNYVSTNISVLSSSLLKDAVDLAFRGAVDVADASALHVVNADGTMRVFAILKQEGVTAAPGRFETDGAIRACCVTASDELVIGVERQTTHGPVQTLELVGDVVPLDCWVRVQPAVPATTIVHDDLATYHEGATVWAIADGIEVGPFVVTAGAIQLPEPAADVYVGRWSATTVITLPVPKDVGEKTVIDRPVRPHSVRVNVIATSSIAIGSETDGPFACDLSRFGGPADTPLLASPFTGKVEVVGLAGYSDEGKVILTQVKPGRMTVRDLTVETER